MKKILMVLLLVVTIFSIAGCNLSVGNSPKTVTFDTDGGTAIEAQIVNPGEKATMPEAPTKEGYTFEGWFVGETAYDFEAVVTEDITVKAKWTQNTYTVTFDADNGTENTVATVTHGATVAAPAEDPTKEGHTFAGWFVGETAYDFEAAVTDNITVKAAWLIDTYIVTFDANTGSAVPSQAVNYGDAAQKPADPTKPGFALVAWYLGEDEYDFATPVTGNITLKAEWKVDLPDLTVIAGTWTGKEQVMNNSTTYEFTIAADGTITASYNNGNTDVKITVNYVLFENNVLTINYDASSTVGGNMIFTVSADKGILTAGAGAMGTQLELYKNYTVTFDWGNYKDEVDPTLKTVTHGSKVSAPTKSWTGNEIKAWLLDGVAFDFNTPITSDITLVANWGPKQQTVTFYKQDGTVLKVVVVNYNDIIPAEEIPTTGITTTPGAIFNGYWYGSATSNTIVKLDTLKITGNKNYYPGIQNPMTDIDGTWTGTDSKGDWTIVVDAANNSAAATLGTEVLTVNWFRFQELSGNTQLVINYTSSTTTTSLALTYDSEANTLSSSSLTLKKAGAIEFTVTFDTDGGSEVGVQTVAKDATAEEPTAPTKAGFTFAGWYLNNVEYDFATPVTDNITLVAKWGEVTTPDVTYTVTFTNGSTTTTREVVAGECAVAPTDPSKSGKIFMGWFDGETKFDATTPINGDFAFVAKWGYEVIFYTQDKVEVSKLIVEEGTAVPEEEIPAATVNEGFIFTGTWHKSYTVSAAPLDLTNVTAKMTCYPGVIAESITNLEGTWIGEKDGKAYSFTITVTKDGEGNVTGATVSFTAEGVDYEPVSIQYNASSTYMQLHIKYYKSGSTTISSFSINYYSTNGEVKLGSPSIVLTKA